MSTYLLTWNSDPSNWSETSTIYNDVKKIQRKGILKGYWSTGNTKRIVAGDRIFLIKLRKEPKGIVASGWAISDSFEDGHWNEELASEGKTANYVQINFDTIVEPEKCFPRKKLEKGIFAKMNWSPAASGITIKEEIAEKLEDEWAKFLGNPRIDRDNIFPEEAETQQIFIEGAIKTVTVNYYERDKQARQVCINHYGLNCAVCGFNFEESYGEIGKGFIHVHHLKSLSS